MLTDHSIFRKFVNKKKTLWVTDFDPYQQ